jgi:dephospho-CoA kinase
VVEADGISREILEPDGAAYGSVVEHFGPGIVASDGRINRPALAAKVFADSDALAALNKLTHPVIARLMADRVTAAAESSSIVVLDIALLSIATPDLFHFGAIVVVDTPEDVAVERLVAQRGFSEADARARLAAQISREERRKLADVIIDNRGDRTLLDAEITRAWKWLQERAKAAD